MARLWTPGMPKTWRTPSAASASTTHWPPVRSSVTRSSTYPLSRIWQASPSKVKIDGATSPPAVRLGERRLQGLRQLRRRVDRPEVHVEETGRLEQSVVVEGGHVDAVLPQRPRDGIDFLIEEHEVTGDRGVAVRQGLEIEH